MVRTLLTVMFLGLFPASTGGTTDALQAVQFSVAPPAPVFSVAGRLSASGVVILDIESGQSVYSRDARVQRPMASLTKLMTAILIVENHDLSETVTVPKSAESAVGNKVYLTAGKNYRVGDLLSALLVNSANDAAITLALFHSGSLQTFVEEMNTRALQLGLKGTSFQNPIGLDHPSHWSTPRDIAWLTAFALRNAEIEKRMGMAGATIASLDGTETVRLYHTNVLMHDPAMAAAEGPTVVAGKTGTTDDAGECLVSVVEESGHRYVVVLLGSLQRYKDMDVILGDMATAFRPSAIPVQAAAEHPSIASH
ncbi:D-alanyl-D-alanine carboxypeptidase [Candidatus Peregrinibacteria bacterium]|nr:D-alanyl-D-alanine carboxypeptidase [Candidatus Peregrinibacteria bacterium]